MWIKLEDEYVNLDQLVFLNPAAKLVVTSAGIEVSLTDVMLENLLKHIEKDTPNDRPTNKTKPRSTRNKV
jgi:hypothetical protein